MQGMVYPEFHLPQFLKREAPLIFRFKGQDRSLWRYFLIKLFGYPAYPYTGHDMLIDEGKCISWTPGNNLQET